MCSWSSWGNRMRSKVQQRECIATNKKSLLTDCSGLWPTRSNAPSLLLNYPHGNLLFYIQEKLLYSDLWLLSLILPVFTSAKGPSLCRSWGQQVSESIPSPGWTNPTPSASPHKASGLASATSGTLLNCNLLTTFMYSEAQRWTQYSRGSQTNA